MEPKTLDAMQIRERERWRQERDDNIRECKLEIARLKDLLLLETEHLRWLEMRD